MPRSKLTVRISSSARLEGRMANLSRKCLALAAGWRRGNATLTVYPRLSRVRRPHKTPSRLYARRFPRSGKILSGADPDPAGFLGPSGLPDPAALRHGSGRRHVPSGDHPAFARPEGLEGRLCAALTPAEGRALRREPQPSPALLSVSGDPQAFPGKPAGALPRFVEGDRRRHGPARRALRRGRLGKPDPGRLGPGLGVLV